MKDRRTPKEVIEAIERSFRERERKRQDFTAKYGHVKRPSVIRAFEGKTVSVLEGSIYFQTSDKHYDFMDVLHDHALLFFGTKFLESEELKPLKNRHPALQWMFALCDDDKGNPPTKRFGVGMAWYRFANDLYTIRDNAKLEALLRKRLLRPATFQGARHELRVAALCIAAGFNLEFEDDMDNTRKHVEFAAIDQISSVKILVEAKSRHRRSVLGFTQGPDEKPGNSVGVKNIVLSAYKKDTSLPLYVFVDVNLPPATGLQFKRWLQEIDDTMMELASKGYTDPCPANAIFFCNDPTHFIDDRELQEDIDQLWIKHYEAEVPRSPHPPTNIVDRLVGAYLKRVSPPVEIDFE